MKLLHLGDLHLGKSLGDFDLIEDQRYILEQILELAKSRNVDGVIIAGDVYDRAIPSEAATRLLDEFLTKLAEQKVAVYMISGNHDSDERLNFGSSFFETNDIYISAKFNGKLYCKTVKDEFGEVNLYLLPFVKASQVRHFYQEAKIDNYEDAVKTIIEAANIDTGKRNVLVSHQFVAGNNADPELSGSEGVATQSVGLVEKIGYGCFDDFDYVALGHIHSPQRVGREEVRYAGSPIKYSLSEVNNEKSVPIITLGQKGDVNIELVPLKPMRNMRHIKGTMDKLLDKANISSPDDYIYVTLTDEEIVNDSMGIFQQYYPRTLKIDYENSHTREIQQVDISKITENKTFPELIGEFYSMIYSREISDEEMRVMCDVAKKVGVMTDEAD
jgi:exonuclease SbcD